MPSVMHEDDGSLNTFEEVLHARIRCAICGTDNGLGAIRSSMRSTWTTAKPSSLQSSSSTTATPLRQRMPSGC
eukprot:3928250-Rhodomonas_salina.2